MRADLERSVGVTTATPLVWLNRSRALSLPTNRKSSVINSKWHGRTIFITQTDSHKDGYMLKAYQESNETLLDNLTIFK